MDPIRVDWVQSDVFPEDHLGITSAPGTRWFGSFRGGNGRLTTDLGRLKAAYKVDTLVCLLGGGELRSLGISNLPDRARDARLDCVQFPIADGTAPQDGPELRDLVDRVLADLDAGLRVVFHCRAGLGRSGTLVAYCLVRRGVPPDLAVDVVRRSRPGAIETAAQKQSIFTFNDISL